MILLLGNYYKDTVLYCRYLNVNTCNHDSYDTRAHTRLCLTRAYAHQPHIISHSMKDPGRSADELSYR